MKQFNPKRNQLTHQLFSQSNILNMNTLTSYHRQVFTQSNQINKPRLLLFISVIIFSTIHIGKCQTSIPQQQTRLKQISMGQVQLYQSGTYQHSVDILYNYAMAQPPAMRNTLCFLSDMELKMVTAMPDFQIFFEITIPLVSQTQMTVKVQHNNNKLNKVSIRYLVIDSGYINQIYILAPKRSLTKLYLDDYRDYDYIDPNGQIPKMSVFLVRVNFRGYLASHKNFEFQLEVTPQPTRVKTEIILFSNVLTNYQNANFEYRILTIYHFMFNDIERYRFHNQIFDSSSINASQGIVLIDYVQGSSVFVGGLYDANKQIPSSGASNPLFQFTSTVNYDNKIFLSTSELQSFRYSAFWFNYMGCPNSSFPHRVFDSNHSIFVCQDICLQGQYTYILQNDHVCLLCDSICKTCTVNDRCDSCHDNYVLNNFNRTCIISEKYFDYGGSAIALCDNQFPNCFTCSAVTNQCYSCLESYYLNNNQCLECSILFSECAICNQLRCFTCNLDYELTNLTKCTLSSSINWNSTSNSNQNSGSSNSSFGQCTDYQNCQLCASTNSSFCFQCFDHKRTIVNGNCSVLCGDRKIVSQYEQCDDGNAYSYDGCSELCQKQDGFDCQINFYTVSFNTFEYSKCFFTDNISISVKSIKKDTLSNKVQIQFDLSNPYINGWARYWQYDLKELFTYSMIETSYDLNIEFTFNSQQTWQNPGSFSPRILNQLTFGEVFPRSLAKQKFGIIYMNIAYSQGNTEDPQISLNHQKVNLIFAPKDSNLAIFSKVNTNQNLSFALITDNNQHIQYYSQQFYDLHSIVNIGGYLIAGLGISMFVGSLIASIFYRKSWTMLIALQYAAVCQIVFYSISTVGQLNTLFIGLIEGLKYINGISIQLVFDSTTQTMERALKGLGMESHHFIDNSLIYVGLVIVLLIIGIVLKIVNKIIYKKQVGFSQLNCYELLKFQNPKKQIQCEKISNLFLSNLSLGVFIFFAYSFFFNIGVQIGSDSNNYIVLNWISSIFLIIIWILFIVLIVLKFDIFSYFVSKISNKYNLPQNSKQMKVKQNNQLLSPQPKDIQVKAQQNNFNKKFYLIFILSQRLINGLCLNLFSDFSAVNLIPIIIYAIFGICSIKLKFIQLSQRLRFLMNMTILLIVQMLFFYRNIVNSQISQQSYLGGTQNSLNQYMPLTIMGLLLCNGIVSFLYFLYSIEKFRCFKLEIGWNKVKEQDLSGIQLNQYLQKQLKNRDNQIGIKEELYKTKQYSHFKDIHHKLSKQQVNEFKQIIEQKIMEFEHQKIQEQHIQTMNKNELSQKQTKVRTTKLSSAQIKKQIKNKLLEIQFPSSKKKNQQNIQRKVYYNSYFTNKSVQKEQDADMNKSKYYIDDQYTKI